jgi:hypothetical protein
MSDRHPFVNLLLGVGKKALASAADVVLDEVQVAVRTVDGKVTIARQRAQAMRHDDRVQVTETETKCEYGTIGCTGRGEKHACEVEAEIIDFATRTRR